MPGADTASEQSRAAASSGQNDLVQKGYLDRSHPQRQPEAAQGRPQRKVITCWRHPRSAASSIPSHSHGEGSYE